MGQRPDQLLWFNSLLHPRVGLARSLHCAVVKTLTDSTLLRHLTGLAVHRSSSLDLSRLLLLKLLLLLLMLLLLLLLLLQLYWRWTDHLRLVRRRFRQGRRLRSHLAHRNARPEVLSRLMHYGDVG